MCVGGAWGCLFCFLEVQLISEFPWKQNRSTCWCVQVSEGNELDLGLREGNGVGWER